MLLERSKRTSLVSKPKARNASLNWSNKLCSWTSESEVSNSRDCRTILLSSNDPTSSASTSTSTANGTIATAYNSTKLSHYLLVQQHTRVESNWGLPNAGFRGRVRYAIFDGTGTFVRIFKCAMPSSSYDNSFGVAGKFDWLHCQRHPRKSHFSSFGHIGNIGLQRILVVASLLTLLQH